MEPLSCCTDFRATERPFASAAQNERDLLARTPPLCVGHCCALSEQVSVSDRHSATQNPPEGCYVFLSHVGA